MKIVFFTYYFSPDLCAGSFRASTLAKALSKRLKKNDELHIITTHPNRYKDYRVKSKDMESDGNIKVHRINVPKHNSNMLLQVRAFIVYALAAYKLCKKIKPYFLIGTTGRLMTGVLTGVSAYKLRCKYFIDLRDIFSETISDMFLRKNKLMGSISKSTFFLLEKQLFNKASGVNVVSEGFPIYYEEKGIDTSNWSFFPNGVDKEFIDLSSLKKDKLQGVKTIMYAGNIGGGQGLDKILPHVAKIIGDRYRFLIIGDGSTNLLLRKAIKSENVNNIEILSPVNRNELIENYLFADILFLHLNDIPAFRRVLPSKIFEYVALRKPIVAGLSGYSAQFMADNVPSAIVFNPGDVDGCVYAIKKIENIKPTSDDINMFINKYSREKIMNKMAEHILTSMLIKP